MLVGVGVKAVAAISLSGGSYLTGTVLPTCLKLGNAGREASSCGQSLCLSLVLCFGGGVLFATSIIHILSEARNELPIWSDTLFCIGFMLLYVIDEFIKLYENADTSNHCEIEGKGLLDRTIHHRYGSTCEHANDQEEEAQHDDQEDLQDVSIKITSSKNKRIGLLLAFSVHSIIEGLVIGVQPIPAKVLLLLGAVSSHKLVVSFCLGAELVSDGRSFVSLSQSMLIYSLGSSVGIILGILIDQWQTDVTIASIPILQALAAGSLLYVTVSEVLPRERSRWEHQSVHPSAGLLQFICFFLGFSIITSLMLFT